MAVTSTSKANPLASSRILVTGGAGFIGSALIWALNRRGLENILVSDYQKQDEKWKNLVPLRFADYIEADDLHQLARADSPRLADIGCVFHLGACSATTERDAAYLIRNNYEYTKDLAAWALARQARFVYASSAATYGDGDKGMSDSAELTTLRPLNMYGYSKHLFDLFAHREGFLDRIAQLAELGPLEIGGKIPRKAVVNVYFFIVRRADPRVKLHANFGAPFGHGPTQRLHRLRIAGDGIIDQIDRADPEAFTELLEFGEARHV